MPPAIPRTDRACSQAPAAGLRCVLARLPPDAARSNRTADFLGKDGNTPFEKIHVILDILLNDQRVTFQPAAFKGQHFYDFLAALLQSGQLLDNLGRQHADFGPNQFGKMR